MTMLSPVGRRYATALVDAAKAAGNLGALRGQLDAFVQVMNTCSDLRNVLLNPVFTAADRERVLHRIAASLGMDEILQRFLLVLSENRRMEDLDSVCAEFRRLADARSGKVQAQVTTPSNLGAGALAQLKHVLEMRTGKSVDLNVDIDPSLIGGLRAQVGSVVYDGSIRAQLARLAADLRKSD